MKRIEIFKRIIKMKQSNKEIMKKLTLMKKHVSTSLVTSAIGLLFASNAFAGGAHGGEHANSAEKAKPACSAEHAAMGHCEMDKAGGHGHSDGGHGSSVGMPVESSKAMQTVNVDMLDTMRFVFNDKFDIKAGKVIQFKVTNKGKIRHEFSIGNFSEQEKHAKTMMANPTMNHGSGEAAITVEAGETKTLTWSFAGNEEIVFACTLPGHYQAGMFHKQTIVN